jgi:hypothetical protein
VLTDAGLGVQRVDLLNIVARSRQASIIDYRSTAYSIFLPEERANTYTHKEIRSTDCLTYSVRFSWSCLAEPFQLPLSS